MDFITAASTILALQWLFPLTDIHGWSMNNTPKIDSLDRCLLMPSKKAFPDKEGANIFSA
ncbi:hypothetical protein [Shewanella violacea]|uniref:Uncharacterized protein n=1 Tax=Shewanella violacea (strain JCM 10179 / CIP 106290 / LMG 19151 / DSS12) TaxID=637905 RepID=D4ZF87_SHEVD|nr:hypothetical protein [Shewanella violacea]BAJ04251.1 hypothetical protein SVI_4280 [Shewanella violacea DSS12]